MDKKKPEKKELKNAEKIVKNLQKKKLEKSRGNCTF